MEARERERPEAGGTQASQAIRALARRFPQLYIPPAAGCSASRLYQDIVRRGKRFSGELGHFIGSDQDRLWKEQTPVGDVEVLFLRERRDFECCYRVLACRCEPREIPPTMGAATIGNLNDWSKIHAHMARWEKSDPLERTAEFRRFTGKSQNYKTTLILLSQGPYSAVDAGRTPYSQQEWLRVSFSIRLYHELTHVVCRRQKPQLRHAVFDEILADCMGLVMATGRYQPPLARAFLGIGADGSYQGGRLENYLEEGQNLSAMAQAAHRLIGELERRCAQGLAQGLEGYPLMLALEEQAPRLIDCFFEDRKEIYP